MDDLFRPGHQGMDGEKEGMVHLDPLLSRRLETRPWEVWTAHWRAWDLAEMVFGEGVRAELTGHGGFHPFRGILSLTVPFKEMEDHRRRERIFLSWSMADPLLSRVPFVFIFQPEPEGSL